jgi:hypothetical protein
MIDCWNAIGTNCREQSRTRSGCTCGNTSLPILLAATKNWSGKEPQSFAKVMRQVKARLIESRGTIQVVIVFCDYWDSASFEEEHREELRAHDQNGVRFLFILVGVPDKTLVPIAVDLG